MLGAASPVSLDEVSPSIYAMDSGPHQPQTFYDPASGMYWTDEFEGGNGTDDQSDGSGQMSDESHDEDEAHDEDETPVHGMVFNAIMDWGDDKSNRQKIDEMWQRKGGWEGWAQVELAALFNADREEHVYADPQGASPRAADFIINFENDNMDYANLLDRENVVIELKCESEHNKKRFQKAVAEDIMKINDVIKSEYTKYGCYLYAIALSMSKEGDEAMEGMGMNEYLYEQPDGNENVPFRLWWTGRYIPGWFNVPI